MKQIALLMAIVGLAATGCTQSHVFGPHARRGGNNSQFARRQAAPRPNLMAELNTADQDGYEASNSKPSGIQLAMFGKRKKAKNTCCDDTCCDVCPEECGCPDDCCDSCCDDGCCTAECCDGGCADGCCCSDGSCGAGGCSSDGCSSCGGRGCGLCQRMVGRVANGFCPHSGGYPASYNYNPSPATGQVAYPYYTVRGPRDFFRNNPPSIGPY